MIKENDQGVECPPDLIQIGLEPIGESLFPNLEIPPDPALVALGWERRFMTDPARAQETIDLYTELGFEVREENVKPTELSDVCGDCRLVACKAYSTIYTRKPPP